MTCQNIEGVGINDEWTVGATYLGDEGDGGVLIGAKPRSDSYGIKHFCLYGFAEVCLLVVQLQYGFRHTDLHDVVVALRGMGGHLADTSPEASLGGEDRCAAHAIAASDEEGIAHASFVGEILTRFHQLSDV